MSSPTAKNLNDTKSRAAAASPGSGTDLGRARGANSTMDQYSMGSSAASSQGSSIRERMNNSKHFTEGARLHEVVEMYSTLDDDGGYYDGGGDGGDLGGKSDQHRISNIAGLSSAFQSQKSVAEGLGSTKSFLGSVQQSVLRRLFKANYVLLENWPITPLVYQLILLLEFLQLLFFIFYQQAIINEFNLDLSAFAANTVTTTDANNTVTTIVLSQEDVAPEDLIVTFRFDSYFTFINFPMLALKSQTFGTYFNAFLGMNILFYLVVVFLFLTGEQLFSSTKNGEIKEGTRIMVRVLSLVVTSYITFMQIPMMVVYLQGYLCGEDPDDVYITDVTCESRDHSLMIALSTITLIPYMVLTFIQKLLFTSRSFESKVPWASLEPQIDILKMGAKFIISASWVFDKYGKFQGYVQLFMACVFAVITYRRVRTGVIVMRQIYYSTIIYETTTSWLYFMVGILNLSVTPLTTVSTSLLISIGFIIGIALIYQTRKAHKDFLLKMSFDRANAPTNRFAPSQNSNDLDSEKGARVQEMYLFCLYELISSNDHSDEIFLKSVFLYHLDECQIDHQNCLCHEVIRGLDQFSELKQILHEATDFQPMAESEAGGVEKQSTLAYLKGRNKTEKQKSNTGSRSNLDATGGIIEDSEDAASPHQKQMEEGKSLFSKGGSISPIEVKSKGGQTPNKKDIQKPEMISKNQFAKEDEDSKYYKNQAFSSKCGQSSHGQYADTTFNTGPIIRNGKRGTIEAGENSTPNIKSLNMPNGQLLSIQKAQGALERSPSLRGDSGKGKGHSNGAYTEFNQTNDGQSHRGGVQGFAKDINPEEMRVYFNQEEQLLEGNGSSQSVEKRLKKVKKFWNHFLTIMVNDAVQQYPKSIWLRILSSFVQRVKVKNQFKAIFELLNCDHSNQSLQANFIIFRRKVLIEQSLIAATEKNSSISGNIDVKLMYRYEKDFQYYALLEYVTANSALGFWRELLQKNIDSQQMQKRGAEISANYNKIQDVAKVLLKIFPNEIKFLYRYGIFLKQIVNNEFDALSMFEKAYSIFTSKISKKGGALPTNEQTTFGENTACAIIVLSSTPSDFGKIMHCNEEVSMMVGYHPKELIGQNISSMMPIPIGQAHQSFLQDYFETAKARGVINQVSQLFGATFDSYLRLFQIMVKVYPQLNNKILFLGFIQRSDHFDKMTPPLQQLENHEQHYILTNLRGDIFNVSEGLNVEMGLNQKFFTQDEYSQSRININLLCPDLGVAGDQMYGGNGSDRLEGEGQPVTFDTSDILEFVELEQLTSEEVLEIRSKLGTYHAYVQLLRAVHGAKGQCQYHLYRVILTTQDELFIQKGNLHQTSGLAQSKSEKGENSKEQLFEDMSEYQEGVGNSMNDEDHLELSSVSSSLSNTSTSFKKMIQDFKKALSERKTPGDLLNLNRIIIVFTLVTITLSLVEYLFKIKLINNIIGGNEHLLQTNARLIQVVQLSSNIRSLVNIANNYEVNYYHGTDIAKVGRFKNLGNLIQTQANELSATVEFLSQQRVVEESNQELDPQSVFEMQNVKIWRLDLSNRIFSYDQPYRVAINSFLNFIQILNMTTANDLILPGELMLGVPPETGAYSQVYNETTAVQKAVMMLVLNGLRQLREMSQQANDYQMEISLSDVAGSSFMATLILGIIVSSTSTLFVTRYIWFNERNKASILSLYALLRMRDIKKVFDKCDWYLDCLVVDGALEIDQNANTVGGGSTSQPSSVGASLALSSQVLSSINKSTQSVLIAQTRSQRNSAMQSNFRMLGKPQRKQHAGNNQNDDSMLSEEEKEEQLFNEYLIRKKIMKKRELQNKNLNKQGAANHQGFFGYDRYHQMMKNLMSIIREIQEREQGIRMRDKLSKSNKKDVLAVTHKEVSEKDAKVRITREAAEDTFRNQGSDRQLVEKPLPSEALRQNRQLRLSRRQSLVAGISRAVQRHSPGKLGSHTRDKSQIFPKPENDSSQHPAHQHHLQFDEEDSEDSDSSEMRKQIIKKREEENSGQKAEYDLVAEELEHRKKLFYESIKNKNWRFLSVNIFFGLLFTSYFLYAYFHHSMQEEEIKTFHIHIPLFFNRYTFMMLNFAFMRERIINNNSVDSFYNGQQVKISPRNVDYYYQEQSFQAEQVLQNLWVSPPRSLQPIVDFVKVTDSESLCVNVIGEFRGGVEEKIVVTRNLAKKLVEIRKKAYQVEIQTIIAACTAASNGDVEGVKRVKAQGVNLNNGDYDRRTPLHVAAAGGHFEVVRYLLEEALVDINPVDRWGATPLNDAQPYPQIKKLLEDKGAYLGKLQPPYQAVQVTVTDDQFRLYYAAYYGDTVMMDSLRLLGWNVNGQDYDGRTALGIAASQGQLQAVKYLVQKGADLSIKDARGNDPLGDATRENRTETIEYLSSIINESLIRDYCSEYEDGLLLKGMKQTIGIFLKKMADLQIAVAQQQMNYTTLLSLLHLGPNTTINISVETDSNWGYKESMSDFISTQELYMYKIIEKQIQVIKDAQLSFTNSYFSLSQVLFLVFLAFQLVVLLILRQKLINIMKAEVFQSRGILNLIPEEFFEENRDSVEKLIKTLKD